MLLQDASSVPATIQYKALQLLDLHERAVEERERVAQDIQMSLDHFVAEHQRLALAVDNAQNNSVRALGLRSIIQLEIFMQQLWNSVSVYVVDPPELPKYSLAVECVDCRPSDSTSYSPCLDSDIDSDSSDDESY